MQLEKILTGVRQFQREVYPQQRELFESLARKQQKPLALFITCADSRVNPNLITQTEPGDLFLIRNAGNIVPPHGAVAGGEEATIEYSVEILGIRHIILCGHSQCGAMKALLSQESVKNLPAAGSWFRHAEATRRIVDQKYRDRGLTPDELAVVATEQNVLVQLNNLSTHPCVAARLASGEIDLHGWYYDIGAGTIKQYDQEARRFVRLDGEARPAVTLVSLATGT